VVSPVTRRRLVVIRSGGLGDTILLLPALRRLLDREPDAELTVIGSHWAEDVRPLVPFPYSFVRFDSPALAPLFGSVAKEDPLGVISSADVLILYTDSPGEPLVRNIRGLCRGRVKVWPVSPQPGVHAADHFAEAVGRGEGPTADPCDGASPNRLRVPDALCAWARSWIRDRLGSAGGVAIHPGSGGRRKCWPPERFAEVAVALGRPVVLFEGPADAEACRAFREQAPAGLRLARADGLPLPEAAALIEACGVFLGNDSGMSHLAGALGVLTVAVFGPTDPSVWAPRGRAVRVARGPGGAWPEVETVREAVAAGALAP